MTSLTLKLMGHIQNWSDKPLISYHEYAPQVAKTLVAMGIQGPKHLEGFVLHDVWVK